MAKQYNRVMLGRGGQFAEECRKDGYIGVGFNIAEDLTPRLTPDYKKFIKQCTPLLMAGEPEKTLNGARLGCGMIWTVCCGLQKGAIVLSPINKKEYIVGEIAGDYYYVPNTELPHRRPVKWYDTVLNRKDMSQKLQHSARSAGTCSDLSQYATEIEALINHSKPASQNEFTWVAFYKELAQKLLPFRHNIQPLLDFIYSLKDSKGVSQTSYIHDSEGNKVPTIDPFSVVAIFNRNSKWDNRRKMCAEFKKFLLIQSEVPSDFSGIPTVNPMRSFFFDWNDWPTIDLLWDLFERVITGKTFEKELDNILQLGWYFRMLTMGFYWIDADSYLALDSRNREFLKKFGINADKIKTAKEYFTLIDQVKQAMKSGQIPYSSIPEFSRDAFEHRSSETPKEQEKPQQTDEEVTEYKPYSDKDFLDEVYIGENQLNTLKSLLLRKKNLILQGAPGVGKTFAAQRLAYAIMGEKDDNRVRVIQFHQNYSYEDFVMGYKPKTDGFSLENGIFYEFCQQARAHRNMPYFLIIDEINRGNMSKIFGELLQLIEADYRDQPIQLAYNKQRFSVPSNLYIIGMMNTADRSLAMIDYALRRRFCFYKMQPAFRSVGFKKYQVYLHNALLDKVVEHIVQLNEVICADASLGEGFAIGHSYFCGLEKNIELNKRIEEIVRYDIIPMLEEYWFDDQKTLKEQTDHLLQVLNDAK